MYFVKNGRIYKKESDTVYNLLRFAMDATTKVITETDNENDLTISEGFTGFNQTVTLDELVAKFGLTAGGFIKPPIEIKDVIVTTATLDGGAVTITLDENPSSGVAFSGVVSSDTDVITVTATEAGVITVTPVAVGGATISITAKATNYSDTVFEIPFTVTKTQIVIDDINDIVITDGLADTVTLTCNFETGVTFTAYSSDEAIVAVSVAENVITATPTTVEGVVEIYVTGTKDNCDSGTKMFTITNKPVA